MRAERSWRKHAATLESSGRRDVFVSYRRIAPDRGLVAALCRELRRRLLIPWHDEHEVQEGPELGGQLVAGIRDTQAFIAVLSPRALASRWCGLERDAAIRFGKRIIVIRLPGTRCGRALVADREVHLAPRRPSSGWMKGVADAVSATTQRYRDWDDKHRSYLRFGLHVSNPGINAGRFLLRGADLAEAEEWLRQRPPSGARVVPVIRRLIAVSRSTSDVVAPALDFAAREKLVAELIRLPPAQRARMTCEEVLRHVDYTGGRLDNGFFFLLHDLPDRVALGRRGRVQLLGALMAEPFVQPSAFPALLTDGVFSFSMLDAVCAAAAESGRRAAGVVWPARIAATHDELRDDFVATRLGGLRAILHRVWQNAVPALRRVPVDLAVEREQMRTAAETLNPSLGPALQARVEAELDTAHVVLEAVLCALATEAKLTRDGRGYDPFPRLRLLARMAVVSAGAGHWGTAYRCCQAVFEWSPPPPLGFTGHEACLYVRESLRDPARRRLGNRTVKALLCSTAAAVPIPWLWRSLLVGKSRDVGAARQCLSALGALPDQRSMMQRRAARVLRLAIRGELRRFGEL